MKHFVYPILINILFILFSFSLNCMEKTIPASKDINRVIVQCMIDDFLHMSCPKMIMLPAPLPTFERTHYIGLYKSKGSFWEVDQKKYLESIYCHTKLACRGRFSPDGSCLSSNGMLYNVREKKVIDRIAYKGFDVDQCIPAFCGHRFIVRSVGHESIMLWNKETKEIEEIFSFSGGVAYSPFESENGNYLLHVGSPVVVWDRANQKELHTVENYGQKIKSGALSASNNLCALGPYNNQAVAVFDLETKTIKTQCGKGALDCFFLDFCNNDKFIIVGSDHKAAIWNVETGECEGVIPFALRLHCMKYNHRNALLVGLNNCGSVQIWNTDQKQMIYSFKLDGMKNVFTIDLDPTGMLLAVYGKDCRLYFVDSELPKKWLQVQLATLAQASFIARAYAAYQQDNYFKIQLGSDDVVSYMKFPAFVRAYLHFCLNIKLPTYQEVVSYRNANEVLSKICNK